jgi:hypothetical protein
MERFRQVHRFAEVHGNVSGFPDFEQGLNGGGDLVYGVLLLSAPGAVRRVVAASTLGYSGADVGSRVRAAHRYASANGFVSGFPDWEHDTSNGQLVYGTILLSASIAERRVVDAATLGYAGDDVGERYRSAHRYAVAQGFVGGFPDWEQDTQGGRLVYGVVLLKSGARREVVEADRLAIFTNFTFAPTITQQQRDRLLERHAFAHTRINACGLLTPAQARDLKQVYRSSIAHDIDPDPNNNASAVLGGRQIWVNFANLFPKGGQEIAQTLIHEMMHCAGYTHPERTPGDTPFDGGPYYSSPPLQAEICIAGQQSDALKAATAKQASEHCTCVDGLCSVRSR